jgi:hypothetical protein
VIPSSSGSSATMPLNSTRSKVRACHGNAVGAEREATVDGGFPLGGSGLLIGSDLFGEMGRRRQQCLATRKLTSQDSWWILQPIRISLVKSC